MTGLISFAEHDVSVALGLHHMSQKDREELLLSIHKVIFKGVLLHLMRTLPEEKVRDMDAFLKTKPPEEELGTYLWKNVPDLEEIVMAEVAHFKKDASEVMSGFFS